MPIMSKPSSAPRTALTFITIGTLLTIWSGFWKFSSSEHSETTRIILIGLFLTGVAFLIIGFSVGYISRQARHAELPPSEVTGAVARQDFGKAAPPVAPAQPPAARDAGRCRRAHDHLPDWYRREPLNSSSPPM